VAPPGGGAELGGLGDDGSRLGARLQPDPRDAEGLRGPQSLIVRRSHLRAPLPPSPPVSCACVGIALATKFTQNTQGGMNENNARGGPRRDAAVP
jgi:hypothetical protein